jgi:hypothetical protein
MSEGASETRLEALWAGDFGNAYVERNAEAERGRRAFWETIVGATEPDDVLEVGANVGGNLHRLVERGFLARGPDSSWDDVTWWLFESPVA